MKIRPLEAHDVDHIKARPGQYLGAHQSRLEIEEEVLKNVLAQYYIAEEASDFLGYIGVWLHEENAEIVTLYVNEEYRHKGVGKALIEAIFDVLKKHHIKQCTLEVSERNEAAMKLYQNAGFKTVAKRAQYYRDGSDALLMLKEIDDANSSA